MKRLCSTACLELSVVITAALAISLPCRLSVAVGGDSNRSSAQSPAQAADIQKLLSAMKKPGVTVEQRRALADQLLDLGDDAARRLADYAGHEAGLRRDAYLGRFEKAAADIIKARFASHTASAKVDDEVQSLRRRSLDVSRGGAVTEKAVREICDPAMKRLSEFLFVEPEQVSDGKTDLQAAREDALDLARIAHAAWEKVPEGKRRGLVNLPSEDFAAQDLHSREMLAALLAMPMNKSDRQVLLGNVELAAKLDSEEVAGIADLNRIRLLLGIGALAIDPKLCDAGRGHSEDMAERKFFAHESPVPGKETPWKRAALAGTKADAENIYMGSTSGVEAIKTWWYSPGHHVNMMSQNRRVGLGRENDYFTQMFGG